jgi:glycosyltransferase involved in cell wall biosynthesis
MKPLSVLFLTDEYLPFSTRAHAKMMHELALKFSSLRHKVVVLTPGHLSQNTFLLIEMFEGIEVWRFRSISFRGKGKILRAAGEILIPFFALFALFISKKANSINFELVVNYSPSIFFAPVARYFKKKKSFVFLVLRDFFPQWAVDQGLLTNRSPITWFFRQVEKLNYRSSNVIAVQSPANLNIFKRIYSGQVDLKVLMNWSAQSPYVTKEGFDKYRLHRELKIPNDKVILFYGGNIGHAQDMANIVRLAKRLNLCEKAHLLLIGQGDAYEMVHEAINQYQLENLTLMPSVPQDKYREYLASADIGLFSLSKTHTTHNFPGKLLGYMVERMPILGSVNLGNDVASIMLDSKSGLVSFNGDDDQLLADALSLIENEALRKEMGLNAYALLKNTFSVNKAYQVICDSYLAAQSKL